MDPSTKDLRHVYAFASEEKGWINEDDHSINFSVSTDLIDRDDEMVTPEAVHEATQRKGQFRDNPAALPCHQYRLDSGSPPSVGHWEPSTARLYKHRCEMRLFFAIGYKLGDDYWLCYSKRHMRAVSIGFRIIESHVEVINGKDVRVITKMELYEISCVAVGANREALARLKQHYGLEPDHKEIVAVDQLVKAAFNNIKTEILDHIDERFEEIKTLLIPDSDGLAEGLLGGKGTDEPSGPDGDKDKAAKRITDQLERIRKHSIC